MNDFVTIQYRFYEYERRLSHPVFWAWIEKYSRAKRMLNY